MKTTLYIQNLKCGGCANTITKNVSSIDAVTEVLVSVEESAVSFDYPSEEILIEVKEKLKTLGYPEDGEANSLGSKAKSYVSCAIGKMS
jgi:copper chaperone CopZ